jgi:hypothetical protein
MDGTKGWTTFLTPARARSGRTFFRRRSTLASRTSGPARRGQLGVNLLRQLTRAVERIERVDPRGEQANLGPERPARLLVEGGEEVGLRRSEALIELGKKLDAVLGGHHSASSPISRIRVAFDQGRRFEVIEEVGHDGAVDAEVLGQGELAAHSALGGGGKDLVAPRTAGEVGDRLMGGCHVGPKDRAQAPSEIVGQGVVAAAGNPTFASVTRGVVHTLIIRPRVRSVVF